MVKCRTCGDNFDPQTKKRMRGGYIDECAGCSTEDRSKMYVGRPGASNKQSQITIFRTDLETARAQLRRESAIGVTAALPLSHPIAEQKIQGKKEEKNRKRG